MQGMHLTIVSLQKQINLLHFSLRNTHCLAVFSTIAWNSNLKVSYARDALD
jgi:hypothetical protein